jgi:hypothetical protein
MTFRTLDATHFIDIANHPEVRPWLGFDDPLTDIAPQFAAVVSDANNFAFMTAQKDGGYLLLKLQPGLYAAHSMAMPAARGRPMAKLMREWFATMFRATDAIEIVTQVPDKNEAARGWSVLAGFRDTFRREAFFPLMGERIGCQFMSLHWNDWAVKDRENLQLGRAFHAMIDQHRGEPSHPADPVHDAMVGATIGCCTEGNANKGIGLYNRWASVAGYHQATLLSAAPVTVDTGDAVVQIEGGKLDVLTVRSAS